MTLPDIDYPNSTALVTGGTSGIGKAIALELASRGIGKLVIVSKSEDKLSATSAEIRGTGTNKKVEVRTITSDLSDHKAPTSVARQIQEWGWEVDILVNNAGFGRKEYFAKNAETDSALVTVDLMVRAVVDLSFQFLPGMVERGQGGILNIGSTAAFQPVPFTAAYAASKAFVLSFSQAIQEESRTKGVRVACVVPGITETNLDGQGHGERRGALDSVGIDTPENVARQAVDTFERNLASNVLGLNNKMLRYVFGMVPDSLKAPLVAKARGVPEED